MHVEKQVLIGSHKINTIPINLFYRSLLNNNIFLRILKIKDTCSTHSMKQTMN